MIKEDLSFKVAEYCPYCGECHEGESKEQLQDQIEIICNPEVNI